MEREVQSEVESPDRSRSLGFVLCLELNVEPSRSLADEGERVDPEFKYVPWLGWVGWLLE